MPNIFLISDTHFGHANALTFKREDGSPLRPFASVEEVDELMVENWNRVVKPSDKVYHLGDVVINKKFLPILKRLNGHKRLLTGNHDIYPKLYGEYFEKVGGLRVFDNMVWSHIPLHPACVKERWIGNVHGHLHHRAVGDPRYFSVCVERINYTPMSVEDVKQALLAQQPSEFAGVR